MGADQLLDYGWLYSQSNDGMAFSDVDLGAQSTNLLSIPISFWLRRLPCCGNPVTPETEHNKVGVRLRLTGVIGFAQFDSISQFDIKSVDLGALYPGIELLFKTGERSILRPYLDIGWAGSGSSESSLVFGEVGLRSEFVFPWRRWELGVEPRVKGTYAFTNIDDADVSNTTVSAKMDARYPLGFTILGETPDVGAYFEPSWFPNQVSFVTPSGEKKKVSAQYEIGATVGFRYQAPMICGLFRWFRLGAGWSFGDASSGWRIRIGGDRVIRLPLL